MNTIARHGWRVYAEKNCYIFETSHEVARLLEDIGIASFAIGRAQYDTPSLGNFTLTVTGKNWYASAVQNSATECSPEAIDNVFNDIIIRYRREYLSTVYALERITTDVRAKIGMAYTVKEEAFAIEGTNKTLIATYYPNDIDAVLIDDDNIVIANESLTIEDVSFFIEED
jgi:hypothetical protein